jgi:hypothetical protein
VLYLSIPFGLLVLVCGQLAARRHPKPVWWEPYVVAVIVPVLGFCLCFFTAPLIQAAVILPPLLAWPYIRRYVGTFVPFSLLAVLVGYGYVLSGALKTTSRYDAIRDAHPFESMESRLPVPCNTADSETVTGPAAGQLEAFELQLARKYSARGSVLRQVHNDYYRKFVNAPNFGAVRMMPPPNEKYVRTGDRPETPKQPGRIPTPLHDKSLSATDESDLMELHANGSIDFVNPAGFGFVKDRNHVAGFLPHGFSEAPAATPRWSVERIELVGLLLHPEPVVYVSERLPSMSNVRDIPTRSLDEFEAKGLVTLQRGGMLAVGSAKGEARMMGALRSARQCVECHGGQRGDLLGAFSYTLRPAEDKR